MEINSKELSTGIDLNNNNNFDENKIKLLEKKIAIYQKENQSLKNKIKILQEDNDDKNLKIQEQLVFFCLRNLVFYINTILYKINIININEAFYI